MTTNLSSELPSTVEETLAACPQFRILVVGNSGVGKTSLVANVFNIPKEDLDIRHDRPGSADIANGYTSESNPRFILHDSQGFEYGKRDNWITVDVFLRDRSRPEISLPNRIHAIWHCIETPRTGSRTLESGDEDLIQLAEELQIPLILLFTKYDLLFNEKFRNRRDLDKAHRLVQAEKDADDHMQGVVQMLSHRRVAIVPISTDPDYDRSPASLLRLTEATREALHKVEGDLWVPWAVAQQRHARQKVSTSINEGMKKYWLDLGRSALFEGRTLWDCISRIHRDVLLVWNFHDPGDLLNGLDFCRRMLEAVPVPTAQGGAFWPEPDVVISIGTGFAGGPVTQIAASLAVLGLVGKFVIQMYRAVPEVAQAFASYIISLTLVLHRLFLDTLAVEPPRPVTADLISGALEASLNPSTRSKIEARISQWTSSGILQVETKIEAFIEELLGTEGT